MCIMYINYVKLDSFTLTLISLLKKRNAVHFYNAVLFRKEPTLF